MIEIELKWALVLYSGILGAIGLFIWSYTEISVRRPQQYLGKQFLWRCTFCGYTYLDESDEEISKCPRCESFVAATDAKARFVPVDSPEATPQQDSGRNTSRRKRHHQRRRGPRRR
ncbi:MAG: hypothetical protein HUU46_10250 [Candidatus Hydrogenedentes bacterium]|nr:hypothetical protein [Candidatus Hydrogenedentota bacterium]